jgi:hypothetical protein
MYNIYTEPHSEGKPFLSIVTRHVPTHRAEKIKKNRESILMQIEKNFEQVFIEDPVGHGMLAANKSFELVKDKILGDYVHLLDDDDYYVKESFTLRMEELAKENNSPDFIFFKMFIGTGDGDQIYPKPDCWGDIPKIARIGGSCFIVKREIYQKNIHHFGLRRCGDFNFLKKCFEDNPTRIWHDELMAETGSVGRGKL